MDSHKEEDIILPETEGIIHDDTPPVKPHKPKKQIHISMPIVFAALGFIVLVIAVTVIITTKSSEPAPTQVSTNDNYYDRDEFSSAMSLAESRAQTGDYIGAKAYLENYNRTEMMTYAQKYRFYQIMTLVYSPSGLNDPNRAAEYNRLAEEARQEILAGKE